MTQARKIRKRNPRVVLVEELREQKKAIARLIDFWNQTGKTYCEPAERTDPNCWWRERRWDEYPENLSRNWENMARNARAMIERYEAIEQFSRRQARYALERERERERGL